MAVPGPPVDLLTARNEFGLGAGGNGLLDLLRSPGGVVPNTGPNAGVPQAAPIGLVSLAGAQATIPPVVNVIGGNISGLTISPTDCNTSYILNSSGAEQQQLNGGPSTFNTWLLSGVAANYDVMATVLSGSVTSGTTGTWLNLGSTRSWSKVNTNNFVSTQSVTLQIDIRPAGGGAILDTANVILSASVDV